MMVAKARRRELPKTAVEERALHALVRVRRDFQSEVERHQLEGTILRAVAEYPIRLDAASPSAEWVLEPAGIRQRQRMFGRVQMPFSICRYLNSAP
jgi:hypothetical protein